MSDFIVGFLVGSIVVALIYMFKFKGVYERLVNLVARDSLLLAELYQILGVLGASEKVMGQVSAAVNLEKLPYTSLLPYFDDEKSQDINMDINDLVIYTEGGEMYYKCEQVDCLMLGAGGLSEQIESHRKRIADLEYALGLILCLNEDAETMTGHERDERATAILENSND